MAGMSGRLFGNMMLGSLWSFNFSIWARDLRIHLWSPSLLGSTASAHPTPSELASCRGSRLFIDASLMLTVYLRLRR